MSVLAGKHVLVIGDETSKVHSLEDELVASGAELILAQCETVTAEQIEAKHIDLIVLNHLHQVSHCSNLLREIHSRRDVQVLPIIALINDNQIDVEQALSLGAADYFTEKETLLGIMNKIRILMGDSVNAADDNVINIGNSTISTSGTARVLVVEDDSLLANLLSAHFDRAKFPHKINKTGENVISDIEVFKPDILLLDLMLPGVSGFDILEEIRNHKMYGKLPVFIFSNRDANEDKEKAQALGVSGFYVKAMTDLRDLITYIEKEVSAVGNNG